MRRDAYEADFERLIRLLTVTPEAIDALTELAIQADSQRVRKDVDLDKQKEEAIALCRRRIEAAIHLYKDGTMDRAEYLHISESNEREIVHWESRTTETKQLAMELALCMEAVDKLARLWTRGAPEDRRRLAQSLFESITYDLDLQQITDFRLKAWADRYVVLRAGLYSSDDPEKTENPPFQEVGTNMPPRRAVSNTCWGMLITSWKGLAYEAWHVVRLTTYDLAIDTYYNLLSAELQERGITSTEIC